jgi:hypothetical protein
MALNLSIKTKTPETLPPQEQQQPEAVTLENQAGDSSAFSDPAQGIQPDWDSAPLPVEEIPAQDAPQGVTGAITTQGGFITYEAFHDGFCAAFELGGHLGKLQTLVEAPQQKNCPDATKAIYDICVETPALHFLIKPGSIWVQRAFAIGSFIVPVGLGCVGEIRTKAGIVIKKPLNKDDLNKAQEAPAAPEMPPEHARPEQQEGA